MRRVALQQIEILKDVPDGLCTHTVTTTLGECRHVVAVERDRAGISLQDSGDEIEECCFAGATGAAHGHLLAGGECEARHIDDQCALTVR